MPKVALILSGAVSLGSFEAGAVTELLYVLRELCKSGRKVVLDVITGASAGSMTAALVARAVMNDPEHRRFLHDAWVKEIDIRRLVEDIPDNALLSKRPILEIAQKFLQVRPGEVASPAPFAPETLWMSFTLSNMNGVDYVLNPRDAKMFTSTFFADRRVFELTRDRASDNEYWRMITAAAVASGNFPMAFHPARVFVQEAMYEGRAPGRLPEEFTFVDGGYFNNEPIREAVQLAHEADGQKLDAERVFILVDANLNKSSADPSFGEAAPLLATVKRLFGILRGEAAANDWLRARRLNSQIAWRDTLLDNLIEIVRGNRLTDPEAFLAQLRGAAAEIVEEKRALFPGRYAATYLDESLARTETELGEKLQELSAYQREVVGLMTFVLNSIAGLDKKAALDLHVICTEPEETAGDRAHAFGGFFEQAWREHDFRIGRRRARELLPRILQYDPAVVPPEPGVEYENPRDLSGVTMKDADRGTREALRDSMVRKAKAVIRAHVAGPKWLRWATGPLASWFGGRMIQGKISNFLELD
jgi:predicted acylesterase/phospholipase RssA